MRAIAVINQKGGVGKTTTAANLGHALAIQGSQVALIDMDPQGHLSAHFGYGGRDLTGLDNLLLAHQVDFELTLKARERMTLLPAGRLLGEVEKKLYSAGSEAALKDYVSSISANTDFLIIDCPPASGHLLRYALSVVNEVMIPVSGDYLALRGLSDLMLTLAEYRKLAGKSHEQWLVMTRFHKSRSLCWEVREKLIEYFPDKLLATYIREAVVLAECPSFGQTAFEYKARSNGAIDYRLLADDFIKRRFVQ